MERLALFLNQMADRVVLDMTGIAGEFDYEVPFEVTDDDRNAEASPPCGRTSRSCSSRARVPWTCW